MTTLDEYRGMRQVELVDVVVDLPRPHPTVVLRERDEPWRELWFPIGHPEGVALTLAWRAMATPRPLTHELLVDVVTRFGIEAEAVRITALEGRTYLAEAVLVREGERQVVACRPSDALTLALRHPRAVPILVAEELLAGARDEAAEAPPAPEDKAPQAPEDEAPQAPEDEEAAGAHPGQASA